MPRACDSCSIRKIKCNGKSPCQACLATDSPCSHLRRRKKPGPKGPRKRTKEAILQIQQALEQAQTQEGHESRSEIGTASTPRASSSSPNSQSDLVMPCHHSENLAPHQPNGRVPLSTFQFYLNIYQSHLHVVWPIIDWEALLVRLIDVDDLAAYALAASVCAATMAQLRLSVVNTDGYSRQSMAYEAEKTRFMLDYPKHQTIDALLTCFFLHVFYSNKGKTTKSTLLLREAITYAHILGLHQDEFYIDSPPDATQYHLRIAWILFITDRAHSLQHDLPPTFKLSPTLPELRPNQDAGLGSAFCSLCRLFQSFDDACPPDIRSEQHGYLEAISSELSRTHRFPICDNDVQRADIVVTDSWLRVVLWKAAIPFVDSTTDPNDQGLSVSFPMSVARDLLSKLTTLSSCALETHGPGMMSKLFEVANSVADVIICAPDLANVGSVQVGPREILCALSSLITSLRTTGDPALLSLLREKMMACALDQATPGRLMIMDVSEGIQDQEDGIY
ncbi:hypothetical protein ACJZ2D_005364 [Fusarium nematophilum]